MRRVRCPTCRQSATLEGNPYRPFCSERCKLLDLAAWADERFRIPGDPVPQEAEGQDDGRADGRAGDSRVERQ